MKKNSLFFPKNPRNSVKHCVLTQYSFKERREATVREDRNHYIYLLSLYIRTRTIIIYNIYIRTRTICINRKERDVIIYIEEKEKTPPSSPSQEGS